MRTAIGHGHMIDILEVDTGQGHMIESSQVNTGLGLRIDTDQGHKKNQGQASINPGLTPRKGGNTKNTNIRDDHIAKIDDNKNFNIMSLQTQ